MRPSSRFLLKHTVPLCDEHLNSYGFFPSLLEVRPLSFLFPIENLSRDGDPDLLRLGFSRWLPFFPALQRQSAPLMQVFSSYSFPLRRELFCLVATTPKAQVTQGTRKKTLLRKHDNYFLFVDDDPTPATPVPSSRHCSLAFLFLLLFELELADVPSSSSSIFSMFLVTMSLTPRWNCHKPFPPCVVSPHASSELMRFQDLLKTQVDPALCIDPSFLFRFGNSSRYPTWTPSSIWYPLSSSSPTGYYSEPCWTQFSFLFYKLNLPIPTLPQAAWSPSWWHLCVCLFLPSFL